MECVRLARSGDPLPVECSVLPLDIGGKREGSVVVFRDIGERKSADRLRWELAHDALTGLYHARHFNHALGQEVTRRREQGRFDRECGGFGLDELLQPGTDQLGEHRTRVSGLQCIELSEQGRMVKGHRAVSFGESLW